MYTKYVSQQLAFPGHSFFLVEQRNMLGFIQDVVQAVRRVTNSGPILRLSRRGSKGIIYQRVRARRCELAIRNSRMVLLYAAIDFQ